MTEIQALQKQVKNLNKVIMVMAIHIEKDMLEPLAVLLKDTMREFYDAQDSIGAGIFDGGIEYEAGDWPPPT